jgi:hypothetical protein
VRSSSFAFRFLVEFCKALRDNPEEPQDPDLLDRIKQTCRGHLKWLHLAQQKSEQRFGANYWVTGQPIAKPERTGSWITEESLLDTAFQILKAAAYMELWDDKEIPAEVVTTTTELMSDWAPSWWYSMKNADKRGKYAWPKAEKDGVNKFRLDEHVWIWRTLKSLERTVCKLSGESQTSQFASRAAGIAVPNGSRTSDLEKRIKRLRSLRNFFDCQVFQREVSARFTTENTVLHKRMLATTRSVMKSRFMLHARDTALLYKEMFDFFGEQSAAKELWETTIQSQVYHTGDQESKKTLRYALYVMLGVQDLRINNKSPNELVRMATEALVRSSSPNGLFAGQLELLTNEPVEASDIAEEDLESYYHASFEVPYILLTHVDQVSNAYELRKLVKECRPSSDPVLRDRIPLHGSTPQLPQGQVGISLLQGDAEQRQVLLHLSDFLLSRSTVPEPGNHQPFRDFKRTMKKAVPFNRIVDSSNIVKLDDEWLYKYPEFFGRRKMLKVDDSDPSPGRDAGLQELKQALSKTSSGPCKLEEYVITSFPMLDLGNVTILTSANRHTKRNLRYCIIDIGSWKDHVSAQYNTSEGLEVALNVQRDEVDSKKRLFSFEMVPKQVALQCYATTEASERPNIKEFFERHSRCDKLPIDNWSIIENYWESELHMSYYQLVLKSSDLRHGIAAHDSRDFPSRSEKQIVRASASFRFYGDFFDHNWTCYILDSTHKGSITKTNAGLLENRAYCQRKVLEQQYFDDILASLTESVGEILNEVKECLGVESGSFSSPIHTTNEYMSWSSLWQEFEPILQTLNADLESTQTVVRQWEEREAERGKEKPQWTSDNESKYRALIVTIRRDIKRQTTRLQHLYETTKSLQDLCSNRLNKTREDLAFRSEQNIAMFTYVTVVFLPLGFAASIFSMNGPPEKGLTITMVITSTIALAATLVALMNAKTLASVAEDVSKQFRDFTNGAVKSSTMMRHRKRPEPKDETPNAGDPNTTPVRTPSPVAGSYLAFWTGYIFIEIPARTIMSACRALGWPQGAGKHVTGSGDTKPVSNSVNNQSPSQPHGDPESLNPKLVTQTSHPRDITANGEYKHIKMSSRVLLGFLTLPLFLGAWTIQIFCLNAWDALALFGGKFHRNRFHKLGNLTDYSKRCSINTTAVPHILVWRLRI